MGYRERCALPSKGEIAFRFIACTGIALALYYTPELKWDSDASTAQAMDIDEAPTGQTLEMPGDSCAPVDDRAFLLNASIEGR